MNTDNALRKLLYRNKPDLPYGFENKVMHRIQLEIKREERTAYRHGILLASIVSLILLVALFVIFEYVLGYNPLETFTLVRAPKVQIPNFQYLKEYATLLYFSIYIGALICILLGIDAIVRQRYHQSKKN